MLNVKNTSKLILSIFITAIALILYGYVCHIAGPYFFWESKTLGWLLLLIAVLLFLFERIIFKGNKKCVSEKIIIGIIFLILLVQSVMFFVIPRTNAYAAAKQFLLKDKSIRDEVGDIKGFFLIPVGGMEISSSEDGEYGGANFNVIIKGNKKYKEVSLELSKDLATDWQVTIIR